MFRFKGAMVFSKIVFKESLLNILAIEKLIKKKNPLQKKKLILESSLILAGIIRAIVPAEVEKRLIWEEKLQNVFWNFGKSSR